MKLLSTRRRFHILRRIPQYIVIMWKRLHVNYPFSCQVVIKFEFSRQSIDKFSDIKFYQNPSAGVNSRFFAVFRKCLKFQHPCTLLSRPLYRFQWRPSIHSSTHPSQSSVDRSEQSHPTSLLRFVTYYCHLAVSLCDSVQCLSFVALRPFLWKRKTKETRHNITYISVNFDK
jgi:hypothetical protein